MVQSAWGQAALLTQAPPSAPWVNNRVDQNTHTFARGPRGGEPRYRAQNAAPPLDAGVRGTGGNAALSEGRPFNPVRAALCESWTGGLWVRPESRRKTRLSVSELSAVLTSLLLSGTRSPPPPLKKKVHRCQIENIFCQNRTNYWLPAAVSIEASKKEVFHYFPGGKSPIWCHFCWC